MTTKPVTLATGTVTLVTTAWPAAVLKTRWSYHHPNMMREVEAYSTLHPYMMSWVEAYSTVPPITMRCGGG